METQHFNIRFKMDNRGSQIYYCFHIEFFRIGGEIYRSLLLGRDFRGNLPEINFIYLFQSSAIFFGEFSVRQKVDVANGFSYLDFQFGFRTFFNQRRI